MKHIVKRRGHVEAYDSRKLYASIYATGLAIREPTGVADVIAKEVVRQVENWLEHKHEVTSNDIRRVAHSHLKTINPKAAVLYLNHRVIW